LFITVCAFPKASIRGDVAMTRCSSLASAVVTPPPSVAA
jgi:hypothetical protein